jgi:hypothetical protein
MAINQIQGKYITDGTITSSKIANGAVAYSNIASGVILSTNTVALFYQATAPTGWTRIDTHNNKALRVVSGTGSAAGGQGSSTGGSSGNDTGRSFTSAFASTRTVPIVDHSHGGSGTMADHRHGGVITNSLLTIPGTGFGGIFGGGAGQGTPGALYGTASQAYITGSRPSTTVGAVSVYPGGSTGDASALGVSVSVSAASATQTTGNTMDFAVQYIDILLCSKA